MGKKFWADVMAFIVFMLGIGGFVTAVGHHYLTEPQGAPLTATVYEDGSWVDDDESGCIENAPCDDKSHGETVAPTCEDEYESTDCYYTQGDTTWYVDANGDAHEVTE